MADPLTPAVSERICKHMNEDHAEAIALYATVFGQVDQVDAARMLRIDPQGMDLAIEIDGGEQTVRIDFDHTLSDSEDAHQTLISMVRQARSR
jgi:putative heme iron utilization protein